MPPPSTAAVGDLPIPSLVLDGDVTLRCDDIRLAAPNTVDVPALAVLGGTLCTDMLWLSNGMLVNAGGTLSVQGSVQELKRAVFRGGTTLLGAAEQKAEFILSGGTAHLADGLAEGSTVEGGAGVFSAQSFSGAAVNDYGAVLWDGADGSAYRGVYGAGYYPTDYSPDWAGTVPSAVWDALNAETPYENDWFAGTLTLENTHAPELLPWGGAHLRVLGENTVGGTLGGTGLLFTGGGSLAGDASIDRGEVHISGGTVSFEHGLWLGEGDIVITGGTVIVPGGEAGLTAENGKVTISGGAVREP